MDDDLKSSIAVWAGVWQEFPGQSHCIWTYDFRKEGNWWICAIFCDDRVGECSTFNAPAEWDAGKKDIIYDRRFT